MVCPRAIPCIGAVPDPGLLQRGGLFVLLGAEFLAMILVVVYVGAVAVLFLFVVMMLDINFSELRAGRPLSCRLAADRAALLAELFVVAGGGAWRPEAAARLPTRPHAVVEQYRALGQIMYTNYIYSSRRGSDPAGRHDRRHRADPAQPTRACEARRSQTNWRAPRRAVEVVKVNRGGV